MQFRSFFWVPALAVLVGCTTWNHTQIADKAQADRQYVLDDGYCVKASHGSVPVPQVSYNDVSPRSSSVVVQGSTYNSATGTTTFSNFSGQTTTAPSPGAAFAGGFANGMNAGAALAASFAQGKIYRACMYAKGWSDKASPTTSTAASAAPPSPTLSRQVIVPTTNKEDLPKIYATPDVKWLADVEEFLTLYPAYRESPLHGRLDKAVRQVAEELPTATGPQILLAAHESLVWKAQGASEPMKGSEEQFATLLYRDAASNNIAGQNALGMGFLNGWKPLPVEPKRAIFWFQQSALAGDPMGQTGYGLLLFQGKGVEANREQGYAWVAKAASSGDKTAKEILGRLEVQMTSGR